MYHCKIILSLCEDCPLCNFNLTCMDKVSGYASCDICIQVKMSNLGGQIFLTGSMKSSSKCVVFVTDCHARPSITVGCCERGEQYCFFLVVDCQETVVWCSS